MTIITDKREFELDLDKMPMTNRADMGRRVVMKSEKIIDIKVS